MTETDLLLVVDEVRDDRIDARQVYEDARVIEADPLVRSSLEETLAAFVGAEARVVFDPRGWSRARRTSEGWWRR